MNEELFAKVVDDMVTVFPITLELLNSDYSDDLDIVDCFHNQKPTIDMSMQQYEMFPVCMRGHVLINYNVKDKTVEDLFDEMNAIVPTVTLATIDPMLFNALDVRMKERIQGMLDDFARTRNYDNIASAISYTSSSVTAFQTEAARCEVLRDTTWNDLNSYLGGVMTGVTPLPTEWLAVKAVLPDLTW